MKKNKTFPTTLALIKMDTIYFVWKGFHIGKTGNLESGELTFKYRIAKGDHHPKGGVFI